MLRLWPCSSCTVISRSNAQCACVRRGAPATGGQSVVAEWDSDSMRMARSVSHPSCRAALRYRCKAVQDAPHTIAADRVTGLVLCGGRGTRMGGVDKGLQLHAGLALAAHALQRLRPQVGTLLVNANRNLAAYAAMGVPVWPDALPDFPGPLAGWLAGLAHSRTPYLVTVPCDTPNFPHDLVPRLAQALVRDNADIAMVSTLEDGTVQNQPVFCLLKTSLRDSLAVFLQQGERRIVGWTGRQRCVQVLFDDATAFFNANTVADLQTLAAASAAPKTPP